MEQDDDFARLAVAERLSHKSWKARTSAYDELARGFAVAQEDSPLYAKHTQDLKRMVADVHLAAQESGLVATLAFLQAASPQTSLKVAKDLVAALLDKCLTSTRTGTRLKCIEILLQLIEVAENGDIVMEALLATLANKQPKLVAQAIVAIREAVHAFGIQTVSIKALLKQLPKMFGNSDKNVRQEAQNLALELYRYIGDPIINFLSDLKPVQIKELQDMFTTYAAVNVGRAKPARLTRSQQATVMAVGNSDTFQLDGESGENNHDGNTVDNMATDSADTDIYELAEPIEVLKKIPTDFYENLASSKWKERKEALEQLLEIVKTPRIKDDRYHELISVLAKRINDIVLIPATLAAQIIECMALGLRKDFAPYRNTVVSVLLEKLKEKKQSVIDILRAALDAVYASTSFEANLEDIMEMCKHKVPQVKVEATQFLIRCLQNIRKPPSKTEIKTICEVMIKIMEEPAADVRDAAAAALGTLMKTVGERPLLMYLERLDPIKAAKVKEYCDKASVKTDNKTTRSMTSATATATKRPAIPAKAVTRSSSTVNTNNKENRPTTQSTSAPAKPSNKTVSRAPSSKQLSDDPATCRLTADSALEKFKDFTSEELVTELADLVWKIRFAAMTKLSEQIASLSPEQQDAEVFVLALSKTPSFNENNFQVAMLIFQLLIRIADWPGFHSGLAALAIPALIDRFSDMKLKKIAAYEPLKIQKSPKVLADALMWIHASLFEFGVAKLNIRMLIDVVKIQLGNTNAKVREAAIAVLTNIRIFVGPDVRNFVADLNPQLLTSIDTEFDKVADRKPPQPTRQQGKLFSATTSSSTIAVSSSSSMSLPSSAIADAEEDPAEALFPRQDISTKIDDQLVEQLNDNNWKIRKEALEKTGDILQTTNNRIKPNVGDLLTALKPRLADSNKNLAVMTLELLAKTCIAMGPPFERQMRDILPGVCTCLADNKALVRTSAITTLDAIADVISLSPLVSVVSSSLMAGNPTLRQELLKWINDRCAKHTGKIDLSPLIMPVINSLQHRDATVRKQAQSLLDPLIRSVGFDAVRNSLSDMKGAVLQGLIVILEQHRPTNNQQTTHPNQRPSTILRPPSPARQSLGPIPLVGGEGSTSTGIPPRSKIGLKRSTSVSKGGSAMSIPDDNMNGDSNNNHGLNSVDNAPVLATDPQSKEKRAQEDRGTHKWVLDNTRPDLLQFLKDQMTPHFSLPLITQLFSIDHYKEKDHIAALVSLADLVSNPTTSEKLGLSHEEILHRLMLNSDLILKYLTLRLQDTNTTMTLKCLDLLECFYQTLVTSRYNLMEYEASAFLPTFIAKIGDSKEIVRQRVHGTLRLITQTYPPSKLFAHIIRSGLESKNARTRAECLDELSYLLTKVEITAFQPSKTFPIIASQITDRDSSVRNAALGVIVQAAMLIGEPATLKYVGKLADKDKALLDEKLKRSDIPVIASIERRAPSTPQRRLSMNAGSETILASVPTSQIVFNENIKSFEEPALVTNTPRLNQDSLSLNILEAPQLSSKYHTVPQPLSHHPERSNNSPMLSRSHPAASQTKDYMIDYIISQITSGDANEAVNALKRLEVEIKQKPDIVILSANQIINAITLQVRLAFVSLETQGTHVARLCKHLLNALLNLYDNAAFAKSVHRNSLLQLLNELLTRLLDSNLPNIEYGPQLARAVNMIMMKILETSDRNVIFGVLLDMLETAAHNTLVAEEPQLIGQIKLANLIMKCIWKLIRYIQNSFRALDFKVDMLLHDMDIFLSRNTPSEWKRRGQEQLPLGDVPLRTMKTLMSELISNYGEDIFKYCDQLSETSYVRAYLRQLLDAAKRKMARSTSEDAVESLPPIQEPTIIEKQKSPSERFARSNSTLTSNPSISSASSTDTITRAEFSRTEAELEAMLASIFSKIGSKDQSKQGIAELYEFKTQHPHMNNKVEQQVAQTGSFFQNYIRRKLAELEKDKALPSTSPSISAALAPSALVAGTRTREGSDEQAWSTSALRNDSQQDAIKQRFAQLRAANQHTEPNMSTSAATATQSSSSFSSISTTTPATANLDSERSATVSQLKERLARMKQNMRSGSSTGMISKDVDSNASTSRVMPNRASELS